MIDAFVNVNCNIVIKTPQCFNTVT